MNATLRTKDEAILDVRYQIRLSFLHERLYKRVRVMLAFAALFAGSAAFMSLANESPAVLRIAALIVAIAGFADVLGGFSEKAARHYGWRRQMADVLARSGDLSQEQIDKALAEHDGQIDDEIESLRLVAMHDNLRSNGCESWITKRESRLERFMRAIA